MATKLAASALAKTAAFPLTFTKAKVNKSLQKVIHRLIRKKGQYTEVSIVERLDELMDPSNSKWHKHVKNLIKRGITYDRKLRIKYALVKLKDIFIDDDIQRNMDPDHIVKIGNIKNFNVEFMSAIQGTKEEGVWRFHSTNAQHTVVYEAALAYHGLWDGFTGDWKELEVPFLYIETNDRSLARRAFQVLNGKFSKTISAYDEHKIEVLSYRVDGNLDPDNVKAAKIQKICEENGYEPISEEDAENKGNSKAITHVSAMRKYKDKPEHWEFILRSHATYWPNIQLHGMEIDLYGFVYEYFKVKMGVDVYSTKFERTFMNPFHAIIQIGFAAPGTLSAEATATFTKWYATTWDMSEDDSKNKIEAQTSLVLLMKLYRKLGGTHPLPDIVDMYDSQRAGDITKYVKPSIRKNLGL